MNPELVGMGVGIVGDLIGGNARKKAAEKQQRRMRQFRDRDQNELIRLRDADQAEALALARDDEARMASAHKAGTGYDLVKLRNEAIAAGFNPLTVLENTGAANYANTPGPVVSSPFVARPFTSRVAAVQGTGQAIVETAGYFGDAMSAGASAYVGIAQNAAQIAANKELAAAIRSPQSGQTGEIGLSSPFGGRGVATSDARPQGTVAGAPGLARGPDVYYPQPMGGFASDGLWRADPDAPAELEADLWGAARGGFVGPFTDQVIRKNMPSVISVTNQGFIDIGKAFWENYPPRQLWQYSADNFRTGVRRAPSRGRTGLESLGF